MSGFKPGKFSSFEEAFEGGRRHEIELAQTKDDEGGKEDSGGLTFEQIQSMSQDDHIARKAEVDAFLEEQGK